MLIEKLLNIRKSLPSITPDKTHTHHGYNYVSAHAIVTAIREQMDIQNVLLFCSIKSQKTEILSNTKGILTTLEIKYTWIDADDSKEKIEIDWVAQATDTQGQGLGKALAFAEKYFLLRFFQIPIDDSQSPQPQQPQQPQQSRKFQVDFSDPEWFKKPIGFKRTHNLTWEDLARNEMLDVNLSGRQYLYKLTQWEDQPEIAKAAKMALELKTEEKIPF
ncbi:MAG: hypothetical protein DRH04_02545 [Deltaproteobacteria bacterium]|nr:MAG: hypothetical protein DRH04_02545 [Deltaproteobacteria bacterium]